MKRPFILGICGGSAAGKSRFAVEIQRAFTCKTMILSQDCYYSDIGPLTSQERVQVNFDHPDAIEHALLVRHLDLLQNYKSIEVPSYDFESCCRKGAEVIKEIPQMVVLEGLFLFCIPEILKRLDFKVAIEASETSRVRRILERDLAARGRTENTVRENLYRHVLPMHNQFIQAFHKEADLVVHNDTDEESELRMQAKLLVEQIGRQFPSLGDK